jgi:predicted helicase
VDYILKTRFGLEGGLAHTADIVEYDQEEVFLDAQGRPDRSKLLKTVHEARPKVLILDPACGTGTFLYAVMDFIRAEFMERGDAGLWSAYVRDHLLPRLFGFELLMAPYAMAHFKMGMLLAGYDLPKEKQKQWHYDFEGDERLGIYLTNTLEEAPPKMADALWGLRILSEEANAASRVKRDLPIMVVLGNPPYSGHSANSSWEVIKGKKKLNFIGQLLRDYYFVDDKPLDEKNPKWLQDDYVKFIRWAQWRIERTGAGVLVFITNHGYLDNPTFRGMRQQLMKTFNEIYILDLHGNSKKKEHAPDGSKDENVFDIRPGVAIGFFIKTSKADETDTAKVHHANVWGLRENKYQYLLNANIEKTDWTLLDPKSPFYLFAPRDIGLLDEYENRWKVTDIFSVNVLGFQTHRDHFAVDFDRNLICQRVEDLRNISTSDEILCERYNLRDNRDWQLSKARRQLQEDKNWTNYIKKCLYRPFDWRWCFFSNIAMDYPRRELLENVAGRKNICLLSSRQQAIAGYKHCWVSDTPANDCVISTTSREANQVFPLYVYYNDERAKQKELFDTLIWSPSKDGRIPNLCPEFVADLESHLHLKFVSDGQDDLAATFGPEDIFNYIYAIFHSPTYRQRYAEFLKIDFPRVPLTASPDLFRKLCFLGEELVALHLLESPQVTQLLTHYPVAGDNFVEKGFPKFVVYEEGQPGYVFINKTQYFEGVPKEVWEFRVGGYQVCDKWLKDRRGRQLSFDDLMHYQKVVVALAETMRLMKEIDKAIPSWPIE